MVENSHLVVLKKTLLREVRNLCYGRRQRWNEPIVQTLQEIRDVGSHAVLFGGTLRSLLISRLLSNKPGRPRDVDIVVAGTSIEEMRRHFNGQIARETRFGGLSMRRFAWQFDVWPLEKTWTFVQRESLNPEFSELPRTTFLNLEAVAVDVWPTKDRVRRIYSGDDQFFSGILARTLEINNEVNPFPQLCVVRSLVMAAGIDFAIGPGLAEYIARHGNGMARNELESVQLKHYGCIRCDPEILQDWIGFLTRARVRNSQVPISLPIPRQLRLWEEDTMAIRLHFLAQRSR